MRSRLLMGLVMGLVGPVCLAWSLSSTADRETQSQTVSGQGGQQPRSTTSLQTAKPGDDPHALFSRGQTALQNGDLDAAEMAFRRVIAIDPSAGGAYSNLGVIAMRRKDWDYALSLLEKAARLEPKVSGIRLNIGLVHYRQGDYAAAMPPLTSVLLDRPDSEQARYLLGLCNLFTQHYADAVSILEPLWPQKSNDFMYLYVLSIAANDAGQKELDERALTRLIDVGGDSPEFHLLLGKAYLYRQETERAVVELEHAASMNPNLPFVHFNLGIAYMRTGDNNRAEEEFRRDIGIEPDLADTYEVLGEFYMRTGRESEAERSFHEALRRNSRMAGSLFGIAKIHLHQDKYEQALAEIDAASRLAPDSQSVHYLHGQILGKLGRKEEAQAEFAAVAKMTGSVHNKEIESFGQGRIPNPELTQQPPPPQ